MEAVTLAAGEETIDEHSLDGDPAVSVITLFDGPPIKQFDGPSRSSS
jgi:hypothetical protein